ncbi:MAG: hypothetical protein SOY11_09215, partial [Prevotella sp.]|nr:hypothetical protein [Prevotella sp.]MDY4151732.1 hypothetical protein [Prevotella sp.]
TTSKQAHTNVHKCIKIRLAPPDYPHRPTRIVAQPLTNSRIAPFDYSHELQRLSTEKRQQKARTPTNEPQK